MILRENPADARNSSTGAIIAIHRGTAPSCRSTQTALQGRGRDGPSLGRTSSRVVDSDVGGKNNSHPAPPAPFAEADLSFKPRPALVPLEVQLAYG